MFQKINRIFKALAKSVIPKKTYSSWQSRHYQRKEQKRRTFIKKDIFRYHSNTKDPEILEILDYLQEHSITIFPYDFRHKYNPGSVQIYYDSGKDLKYVIHEENRMFFKRAMSDRAIRDLYSGLLIDQDKNSPHRYISKEFQVDRNDFIADVGAAEGNFTLTHIEEAAGAYIFEPDQEWIEPLKATFEPWRHKVNIINSYVSDYDSDESLNMRKFYEDHPEINMFKVDIEGHEERFLNACEPIFNSDNSFKIAICTYHKHQDEARFKDMLRNWGFDIEVSEGYMIYLYDRDLKPPYLRRALLRAVKN